MIGIKESFLAQHKRILEGKKYSTETYQKLNSVLFRMGLLSETEVKGLKIVNESINDVDWPVLIKDNGDVVVGSTVLEDLANTIENEDIITFDNFTAWADYFEGTPFELEPFDDLGSYQVVDVETGKEYGFWDATINSGWADSTLAV